MYDAELNPHDYALDEVDWGREFDRDEDTDEECDAECEDRPDGGEWMFGRCTDEPLILIFFAFDEVGRPAADERTPNAPLELETLDDELIGRFSLRELFMLLPAIEEEEDAAESGRWEREEEAERRREEEGETARRWALSRQ